MAFSTHFFLKKTFLFFLFCFLLAPWSSWIDFQMSAFFFQDHGFPSHPFWDWLYRYGIWPGWILASIGVVGGIASVCFKRYRAYLKPCLFLVLTLAIGSGLLIHGVLKENWGRPRPKQVIEFGGNQVFRPFYQPNFEKTIEPAKSFASGHSSMGFYFFALALLGIYYRQPRVYQLGLALAWGLGGLLSFARIAQGGHFFSDTLASAFIMWLTAQTLAYFLLIKEEKENERTHA